MQQASSPTRLISCSVCIPVVPCPRLCRTALLLLLLRMLLDAALLSLGGLDGRGERALQKLSSFAVPFTRSFAVPVSSHAPVPSRCCSFPLLRAVMVD